MNTYATIEDLKSAAGEERLLRMFAQNTGEQSDEFFQRKLDHGAGMVDSYLGRVYTTPIDVTTSDVLAELLCGATVACALCAMSTGLTDLPDGMKRACDDTKEWLQKISDGEAVLPGSPSVTSKAIGVVGTSRPLVRREAFELNRFGWC